MQKVDRDSAREKYEQQQFGGKTTHKNMIVIIMWFLNVVRLTLAGLLASLAFHCGHMILLLLEREQSKEKREQPDLHRFGVSYIIIIAPADVSMPV